MLKVMTRKRQIALSITAVIATGGLFFSIVYLSFNPQPVNVDSIISYWRSQDRVEHEFISLSEIPLNCQHAFIAIEDKNFYAHMGIDLNGMIRGFRGALTGEELGGSTIPQQLIKNYQAQIFNRTFIQKLTESIYAVRLNSYYSKDYILETYLNVIYLGDYTYGLEAAAQHYYDKSAKDLSLEECAYLAAMTQSPEVYKPTIDGELGKERQQWVVKLMKEQGYIN